MNPSAVDAASLPRRNVAFRAMGPGRLAAWMVLSGGWFGLWWLFRQHWAIHRAGADTRPAWRAMLDVFDVHGLFAAIGAQNPRGSRSNAPIAHLYVVAAALQVTGSHLPDTKLGQASAALILVTPFVLRTSVLLHMQRQIQGQRSAVGAATHDDPWPPYVVALVALPVACAVLGLAT